MLHNDLAWQISLKNEGGFCKGYHIYDIIKYKKGEIKNVDLRVVKEHGEKVG